MGPDLVRSSLGTPAGAQLCAEAAWGLQNVLQLWEEQTGDTNTGSKEQLGDTNMVPNFGEEQPGDIKMASNLGRIILGTSICSHLWAAA